MSSSATSSLPTVWLAPPPGLVTSPHNPTIEPASIAISAILASLVLVLVTVILRRKNKGNFLDDTGEQSEQADKRLTISGPLEGILRRNNATDQPTPRLWSGFSSSNSDIVGRDLEVDGGEAAAASRIAFELANTPARAPNIFHITAPYPPYTVELDVLPRSPPAAQQPPTRNLRPPPPLTPQRGNYNGGSSSGNNTQLHPPPLHNTRRHPRSEFGDNSTAVGDKAEVETLRSDLSFPDTDSDSASYDGGRWKPMDNKAVGLLGRHWE